MIIYALSKPIKYTCKDKNNIANTESLLNYTFVDVTTDQIINYDENPVPKEVVIEDKSTIEQMKLLQQLDEEDRSMVFKMVDKMLTNKKFKDFFNKNITAL